jgi:hypothetical protein
MDFKYLDRTFEGQLPSPVGVFDLRTYDKRNV